LSSLNPIGIPFIELLSVDSTNNYAMGLAHAGMAQHGTAVFAHEQLKGKGQRNKEWFSGKEENIALSLILYPERLHSSRLFYLSAAAANAVRIFFERHTDGEITVKWPNDIYWRDRKAAGILIENLWQGKDWKAAVIGIGINVNQTDFGALQSKAVSLKQITGITSVPVDLAREICNDVELQYQQLVSHPGKVLSEYRAHLYKCNETARFRKGSRVFDALVKDVTPAGQLVVMHGVEERFDVGEIEWLI
jgi:BirA family transcriptional regulator, biotin operon repressor / biotin---[acetyl-CoA-carboxylase] ligase